jgi:hypothetical protein
MVRASPSESKLSVSQSRLSKVKQADSENSPSTPLVAVSFNTSTSVLVALWTHNRLFDGWMCRRF